MGPLFSTRKKTCQYPEKGTESGGQSPAGRNDTAWRAGMRRYVAKVIASNEDPHFIAMGLAAGVFIGCTPTIPFHTVLAVLLAFVLQGSKTAAALGVWVCNPLTLPFLYMGSYIIGDRLLGISIPFQYRYEWIPSLLQTGLDTTLIMVGGGVVLGIVPAVVAYFVGRCVAAVVVEKRKAARKKRKSAYPVCSCNTLFILAPRGKDAKFQSLSWRICERTAKPNRFE